MNERFNAVLNMECSVPLFIFLTPFVVDVVIYGHLHSFIGHFELLQAIFNIPPAHFYRSRLFNAANLSVTFTTGNPKSLL